MKTAGERRQMQFQARKGNLMISSEQNTPRTQATNNSCKFSERL